MAGIHVSVLEKFEVTIPHSNEKTSLSTGLDLYSMDNDTIFNNI
jgi:hypothetical protein